MHRCQVRITALVNGKNKVISSISFIIFVCERVCVFRIYIYIYIYTAIGLSPGGSGYFTCTQNMKLVTTRAT